MLRLFSTTLVFVALLQCIAIAAPTRVQGLGSNNGSFDGTNTTITVTLGAAVTSGDTISGGLGAISGSTPPFTLVSLTDDKGNTYNLETQVGDGAAISMLSFSRSNVTNGPTIFTAVISGTWVTSLIVDEFSGVSASTTDARDGAAHGGQFQASPGTGSNGVTSGSFTTSTSGDLLYNITMNNNNFGNATLTPGTTTNASYSAGTTGPFAAFTNLQMNSAWAVQSASGAATAATWTQSQNDARETFLIAIKPAAGGGATCGARLMLHVGC